MKLIMLLLISLSEEQVQNIEITLTHHTTLILKFQRYKDLL